MYSTKSKRSSALNELVASGQLTPEGKRWLIEALDPFHDEQIQLTGFPDMNVANSVVQVVKKQQQIKKSSTLAAGNWDCNVVLWPQPQQNFDSIDGGDYSVRGYTTADSNNNASLLSVPSDLDIFRYPVGGVTAYQQVSGERTFGSTSSGGDPHRCDLSLDTTYLDGASRVIAMGFEVVNTTAPLYKQGSVTVYRQPTPQPANLYTAWVYQLSEPMLDDLRKFVAALREGKEPDSVVAKAVDDAKSLGMDVQVAFTMEEYKAWRKEFAQRAKISRPKSGDDPRTITNQGYVSVWSAAEPPGTLAEATLLTGSQTWEAEKGCYCISTMNTLDNPAKVQMPQVIIYWTAAIDALGGSGVGVGTGLAPIGEDVAPTNGKLQPAMQFIAPFNLAGAYFTGLSEQTTLNINVCWYVERFPDPQEKDLVVLASPSPGHDALAMDIYAKAMRMLPVGVQQNENPFGEWFSNVVRSIGKFVVPALKGAGAINPLAGALGTIGESLLEGLGPSTGGQRPKKQKRQEGNRATPPAPIKRAVGSAQPPALPKRKRNKRKTKQELLADSLRRLQAYGQ